MARGVSNLVAVLILIGVTISAGIVVSRFMMGGIFSSYDRPAHAQVSSKLAMLLTSRTMRVEVMINNPTGYPFCVSIRRVEIYTSSSSPAEVQTPSSTPTIVIAPGSTSKYETILYTSGSYSRGVVVVYMAFFQCQTPQACSCAGTPAYTDAVFIPF